MGIITVKTDKSNGLYLAETEYNTIRLEKRKKEIYRIIERYYVDKQNMENTLVPLYSELNILTAELDVIIGIINDELLESGKHEYTDAHKKLLRDNIADQNKIRLKVDPIRKNLANLKFNLENARKEKNNVDTAILKYVTPLPREIWCCDYTEKLKGEVGTIELNDEVNSPNNQLSIIEPQSLSYLSSAHDRKKVIVDKYNAQLSKLINDNELIQADILKQEQYILFLGSFVTTVELAKLATLKSKLKLSEKAVLEKEKEAGKIRHETANKLVPAISSEGWATVHHIALLPAYQLHRPRYRRAKITKVNNTTNTCDVLMDQDDISSLRGDHNASYNITPEERIYDVPIEYMDCDSLVFSANDFVVVKFFWDWSTPAVIGFVDNPQRCPLPIYLESGFFDLKSFGVCDGVTYFPANLTATPDPEIQPDGGKAYYFGDKFNSEGLVDQQESLSVGSDNKRSFMTDPCSNKYGGGSILGEATTTKEHKEGDTSLSVSVTGLSQVSIEIGTLLKINNRTYISAAETIINKNGTGTIMIASALTTVVAAGSLITTISQFPFVYCPPNIQIKKDTQERVPSSMFSGKLKLFVQSIYGSTREDYVREGFNLKTNAGSNDPTHPEYTFNRGFLGNSWLYTTDEYNYFICRFIGSQIQFISLELSAAGAEFRDILKTHPDKNDTTFATKIEAYILSTAKVSNIGNTYAIIGDPIQGSPLDYGWHANWKGNEATVVCFYEDPDLPQYLSDQHQLTMIESLNTETGAYTFSITNTRLISDSPWWPWTNGLNLYYYDEVISSMIPVEYPNELFGGFTGVFDAPIYNRYTRDYATGIETLDTINIFMDISDVPDSTYDIQAQKRYSNSAHKYFEQKTHNGSTGTKGFRTLSDSTVVTVENLSYYNVTEIDSVSEYGYGGGSGLFFGRSGSSTVALNDAGESINSLLVASGHYVGEIDDSGAERMYICGMRNHFSWTSRGETYSSGKSSNGSAFFEVPLGDSSGCVFGKSTETAHGGYSIGVSERIDKAIGGIVFWSNEDPSVNLSPAVITVVAEISGGYVTNLLTYEDNINPGPHSNTAIPADPGGAINAINYTIQGDNIVSDVDNITLFNEYISPTVSDKPTNTIDTARSSLGKGHKINHSIFTKNIDFDGDSSVGWE